MKYLTLILVNCSKLPILRGGSLSTEVSEIKDNNMGGTLKGVSMHTKWGNMTLVSATLWKEGKSITSVKQFTEKQKTSKQNKRIGYQKVTRTR